MDEPKGKYDDILHLPRPVSGTRMKMSLADRAAQFSPFAALSGYEAAVRETSRLTDRETDLCEDEKELLNEKLLMIQEHIGTKPKISITYFVEDAKKAGGSYVTVTGRAVRVDEFEKKLHLAEGSVIAIERIRAMESDLFRGME